MKELKIKGDYWERFSCNKGKLELQSTLRPIIILIVIASGLKCNGQISINYTRNIDLYKPYTEQAKQYMEVNDKVHSSTQAANFKKVVYQNQKYSWNIGLSYKRITHIVQSKVTGYYEHYVSPSQNLDYYIYRATDLDLVSKSNSFGIINEFDFLFLQRNRLHHKIGLSNELYLFENYTSVYQLKSGANFNDKVYDIYLNPLNAFFGNKFLLSSTNLSLYYRLGWQLKENLSLGTKISLGTNIQSDWDQFRRYAWLGFGIEVGFGKSKVDKTAE